MNQTIEEQLAAARQIAEDASKKRIQLETKLEAAQAKKQEYLDKCKQFGIPPEKLEEEIQKVQEELEAGMKELASLLPAQSASDSDLPY